MFNLSETAKISCYYELFTKIAEAIFRETDRINLYSQYYTYYIYYTYILYILYT